MCLAVPVKIVEKLDDNSVLVEARGARFIANIALIKNVEPGEYALVHAGFIIEKIKSTEAKELLSFYGETD